MTFAVLKINQHKQALSIKFPHSHPEGQGLNHSL